MKAYIGAAAAGLVLIACVAFLFTSNSQWTSVTSDLTMCVEQKMEDKDQINELKREIEHLTNELNHSPSCPTIDSCPACTTPCPTIQCPQCPTCNCHKESQDYRMANLYLPCWNNQPLYKDGFECGKCVEGLPSNYDNWPMPADLCSYISLGGCCHWRHSLGIDYAGSPQFGWGDYMMLDFAFSGTPELKHIVELGTFQGVTSLYLGLMARIRQGTFTTFDISDHRPDKIKNAWLPNMKHIVLDLLTVPPKPEVLEAVNQDNTLFFMDNGDKTTECNRFLEYINKGKNNVMCTHDWDIEVTLDGLRARLNEFGWEPWAFPHSEVLGTHVRCFHRKK